MEEKRSRHRSGSTGGSMVSGLEHVSVLFLGRRWWIGSLMVIM